MGLSLIGHCRRPRIQQWPPVGDRVLTPAVSPSVLYNYDRWPVRR